MSNKPLRITLIVIGLFVLSPLVGMFVHHINGQRELRATEAALLAKGEKLTAKEIAPPLPPPGDNGFTKVTEALRRISKFEGPPLMRFNESNSVELTFRFVGWTNFATKGTNTWSDVETWLDQSAEGLEELRNGLRKPAFNANLDYSLGFNVPLRHLSEFKKGAQLLNTAALFDLRSGSLEDAFVNLRAACELDRVLKDEPLLISQLVRIAADTITLSTIWQFLHSREWGDGELAQMQAMLPPPDRPSTTTRCLEMERALALIGIEGLRRGDIDFEALMGGPSGPSNAQEFFEQVWKEPAVIMATPAARPIWKFAFFDESLGHYLGAAQQMIYAARKSAVANSWRSYDFKLPGYIGGNSDGMLIDYRSVPITGEATRHRLTYLILPGLDRAMLRSFRLETHQSLTSAAIALQRYRLKHGKHPAALADLVPEFLATAPLDYMNGQSLHYRLKEDGGFVLYSVGEDGVDDGGDARSRESVKKVRNLFDGRDYVWPEPAASPTK